MFAKLITEKQIEKAPRCIYIGNVTHVLPTPEQYSEAGYYEVKEIPVKGEPKKYYHYEDRYKLIESKKELTYIEWTHLEVKDERPKRNNLIVNKIRKQYSINDELAILRQKDNSSSKKKDFDDYNSFCEKCKTEADNEISEWEKA